MAKKKSKKKNTRTKPATAYLFGRLAVRNGFVSEDEVDLAFEAQSGDESDPAHRLGEILVEMGSLSHEQMESLLIEQARRRLSISPTEDKEKLKSTAARTKSAGAHLFGKLAVRNGFASEDEVDLAFEAQSEDESDPAHRLGEILVEMGSLTPEQMESLLIEQARCRLSISSREDKEKLESYDGETRILTKPAPPIPTAGGEEASGWLVVEFGSGSGKAHPLGQSVRLGRDPTHKIPLEDVNASRNHARIEYSPDFGMHVVTDTGSRNGTYVNEEKVTAPRALEPGDRIRIGETVMRYAAGPGVSLAEPTAEPAPELMEEPSSLEALTPKSGTPIPPAFDLSDEAEAPPDKETADIPAAAPAEEQPGETKSEAETPPGEQESAESKDAKPGPVLAVMGAIFKPLDSVIAKILPKIHNQRKYAAAGAIVGALAIVFPWAKEESGLLQGAGRLDLILLAAVGAMALIRAGSGPLEFRFLIGSVAGLLLSGIISLVWIITGPEGSAGFGPFCTMLSALLAAGAISLSRMQGGAAPPPPAVPEGKEGKEGKPVMSGLLDRTRRLLRDLSGKRAKEKTEATQRRDELLLEIAEGAVRAGLQGAETEAVARASKGLKMAQERAEGEAGAGALRQKAAVKTAESKLHRARLRLARSVVDNGTALDEEKGKIEDVKVLDGRIKDLS